MKDYHLTVLVIGFGLAYGILYLVRRDHIYIRQGVFWITVAVVSAAFAIWPTLIDTLGAALGIAYPPTLLFLVAIVVLVLKALLGDIAMTKLKRDLRRLNQRIALLEASQPIPRDRDEPAEEGWPQEASPPAPTEAPARRSAAS